jgi:hypothetical protein
LKLPFSYNPPFTKLIKHEPQPFILPPPEHTANVVLAQIQISWYAMVCVGVHSSEVEPRRGVVMSDS